MGFYVDPALADMTIPARRAWGRSVLLIAWEMVYPGETPTLAALQTMQAMTEGEGWYGYAGKPSGWKGSHNWGAVTCSHGPPCDGVDCFQAGDHDAYGGGYQTCFKAYDTPEDGAADMIHIACDVHHGREGCISGDLMSYALALRQPPVYYVGDSPDINIAATHYAAKLWAAAQSIANDLGEPLCVSLTGPAADPGAPSVTDSATSYVSSHARLYLQWIVDIYKEIRNAL